MELAKAPTSDKVIIYAVVSLNTLLKLELHFVCISLIHFSDFIIKFPILPQECFTAWMAGVCSS